MLTKTFDIQLNTKFQGSQSTDVIVNQGDVQSIVFNFRIHAGANEINYDDVSGASLFILKPDRHVVQQTAAAKDGGGYTVTLSQQAVAAHGRAEGELSLYGYKGEVIVTLRFGFTVERNIKLSPGDVESSSEFDALQQAVALLNELRELYQNFPPANHAALNNLSFSVSGHTGFASQAALESEINARIQEMTGIRDALQEAISTIPAGGLRVPVHIELESSLPSSSTLTAGNVGDFYIIQSMDVTAAGHTGKAWVNYQDSNPQNPIVLYRIHDHFYGADGESIVLTPAGKLAVSEEWLTTAQEEAIHVVAARITNPNILHNWDFRNPVNQRGLSEYTTLGYFVDRWTSGRWQPNPGRILINADSIIFDNPSAGFMSFGQVIEFPDTYIGKTLTLSVMLGDGTIVSGTGVAPITPSTAGITIPLGTSGANISLWRGGGPVNLAITAAIPAGDSIDIKAIKLELGSVSTLANDPPVDHAIELPKCQRFYRLFSSTDISQRNVWVQGAHYFSIGMRKLVLCYLTSTILMAALLVAFIFSIMDSWKEECMYKNIVISSGHGLHVRGARDILDEVTEARRVTNRVGEILRSNLIMYVHCDVVPGIVYSD